MAADRSERGGRRPRSSPASRGSSSPSSPPARSSTQAAAVAATTFVAGAGLAAVLRGRRARGGILRLGRRRKAQRAATRRSWSTCTFLARRASRSDRRLSFDVRRARSGRRSSACVEIRPLAVRLPRRARARVRAPACSTGWSTSAASRSSSAPRSRRATASSSAPRPRAATSRGGDRADALRARRRRRPAAVPRALPLRPAHRPGRARVAVAPPARRPEPFEALAWAITEQLIDYPRAAEIQRRIVVPARPPLPAHRPARPAAGRRRSPRRRPRSSQAFDLVAPPRARRWCARRARSPPAASTCARPTTRRGWRRLRAIPGDRLVDARDPRLPRPGPDGPGPGRRPRPHQARRPPAGRRRPARAGHRGRGPGVLRALRAVGRPRRDLRAQRLRRAAGPHPAGTRSSGRAADPLAA